MGPDLFTLAPGTCLADSTTHLVLLYWILFLRLRIHTFSDVPWGREGPQVPTSLLHQTVRTLIPKAGKTQVGSLCPPTPQGCSASRLGPTTSAELQTPEGGTPKCQIFNEK